MRVKDYELIRCNDGGEVRVWYDGQIDILKESHMTVCFREAKRRQTTPPEALCITDHEIRSLYRGGFDAYWHGELNQGRAPNNDTAFIHGIKAVLSARPEAREGWKLVPITPTWAMQCAGNDTGCFEDDYPRQAQKEAATVYEAMLAAAPSVPSPLRRITEESAPVWCQMCGKGVGDGMVSCLRIGCPIVGTPMNNSEGSK